MVNQVLADFNTDMRHGDRFGVMVDGEILRRLAGLGFIVADEIAGIA